MKVKNLVILSSLLFLAAKSNAQPLPLPYSEDWTSDTPDGWTVVRVGDTLTTPPEFNVGILFSASYGSNLTMVDDWVISPMLDLSKGANIDFKHSTSQNDFEVLPGDSLQCWLIDETATTKTMIANIDISDMTFKRHDTSLVIPPASNNSFIAFRYTQSTDPTYTAVVAQVNITSSSTAVANVHATTSPFTLYPNPAKETIQWYIPTGINVTDQKATLYNITGEILATLPLANGKYDIHELTPGIYYIKAGDAIAKFLKE